MKKHLLLAVASFSFSALFSGGLEAQFVQVPLKKAPVREIVEQENYIPELAELINLQTLQRKISILKDLYDKTNSEKRQTELAAARYRSMELCNISRLAEVYKDPKAAWENIKQEYDNQEMEMTLSILDSMPKNLQTGEEIRTEQLANWYLGREVLTSLYATPEKYGELKNSEGFPLWKDQEYLYNQDVNSFIQKLNALLGRSGKIPGVSSQNSYIANKTAFESYLGSLEKKELAKIPEKLRTFPKPPSPLPPAQEILFLMEDPERSKSVFPVWPEPWKDFVNSNFQKYNPNGEMAQIFHPKSLVVKDEYNHSTQKNNRLNVYQGLKKTIMAAQKNYNIALAFQKENAQEIETELKAMGIVDKIDAEDISSLNQIQTQLIEKKQNYIKSIRDKITKNQKKNQNVDVKNESDDLKEFAALPYPQQMEKLSTLKRGSDAYVKASNIINATQSLEHLNYISALEKDLEGELQLTTLNSTQVDHFKKEKEAEKALHEELAIEEEKALQKEYELKIDPFCLNGGV